MQYTKDNINTICSVSRETKQNLNTYTELLLKWQKAINLISPNSVAEIWHRHIADSMQLFPHINPNIQSIVDLGSGGGLPSIVLSILCKGANRNTHCTMIESDNKKCIFLRECIRSIKLNATVINQRIEATDGNFEMATARALAKTDELLTMCDNLKVKQCLFLKGQNYQQEINSCENKWSLKKTIIPSITSTNSAIIKINYLKKIK